MEILFASDNLRKLCEQKKEAVKKLGANSARKLISRLADIMAAKHVRELRAGSPHPLTRSRTGQYALRLDGGHRLVFEPDRVDASNLIDGEIDWTKVQRVRVVFIGDYHDD